MTIQKSSVKQARHAPAPKRAGLIRKTREWKLACAKIDAGEQVEVSLGASLDGLVADPVRAFMAALKRKYKGRGVEVYARAEVIYAVPSERKGPA